MDETISPCRGCPFEKRSKKRCRPVCTDIDAFLEETDHYRDRGARSIGQDTKTSHAVVSHFYR